MKIFWTSDKRLKSEVTLHFVLERKCADLCSWVNTWLGIILKCTSNAAQSKVMTSGSRTCTERSVCIRPDEECRFTSLHSHADVEPNSKCYGVFLGVRVHCLLSLPHIYTPLLAFLLPPPHLLLSLYPVHLPSLSLPPIGSRRCSIPAGPCLFISSEAAMINEALNTSSLSPGPGEPHSWVNRPSRCSTLLPQSWAWGGSTGYPVLQVATHEICHNFFVKPVLLKV